MHQSAYHKVQCFLAAYAGANGESGPRNVLDVGSWTFGEQPNSRAMCERAGLDYVGLDVVEGPNVDLVPKRAFIWDEIEDESYDFVLSTCAFEHNPFFWVTFAEMARVLKQGGQLLVTAPGSGNVHRVPLDCWRFYPDSWAALCTLTGLDMTEVINEPDESEGVVRGTHWWDSSVVATKPKFASDAEAAEFHDRLRPLVEPYGRFSLEFEPSTINKGPAFRRYMRLIEKRAAQGKGPGAPAAAAQRKRRAQAARAAGKQAQGGTQAPRAHPLRQG